jgi:hypothetical protein
MEKMRNVMAHRISVLKYEREKNNLGEIGVDGNVMKFYYMVQIMSGAVCKAVATICK